MSETDRLKAIKVKTMGEMMNEVREILGEPAENRAKRIVELLELLTAMGPGVVKAHKEPDFALGAYFSAFCMLGMMCSSGKDVSAESQLDFVYQTMGILSTGVAKMEGTNEEE